RAQHIGVQIRGSLIELTTGGARLVDIALREHDLDVRRQEPSSRQVLAGRGNHATAGTRGSVHIALCETQQCETRLRFESAATRLAVCTLGQVELPSYAMNFCLQIVRTARSIALDVAHTALHGAPRFLDSFG